MDVSNKDIRRTWKYRQSQIIWNQNSKLDFEERKAGFLPHSHCKEMRSTSYKMALLNLYGADRWEIIPTSPRVREAPVCFPCRVTLPEKQTLNSLLAHALMPKPTVSHPENSLNTSLTPIAGICRQIGLMRHISESRFQNRFAVWQTTTTVVHIWYNLQRAATDRKRDITESHVMPLQG